MTRPTNKVIAASIAALALVAIAGCGGGGGDSSPMAGGSVTTRGANNVAGGPGTDGFRACDLVTLEALSEVLEREVIFDPSAENDTTCSYLTTGSKMLVFSIDAYLRPASAEVLVGEVLASDEGSEAIDIGEGGYVSSPGTQVGFVLNGVTYQVNLGGGGADSHREETIAIARLVEQSV